MREGVGVGGGEFTLGRGLDCGRIRFLWSTRSSEASGRPGRGLDTQVWSARMGKQQLILGGPPADLTR